jgi:hypothetical protein
MPTDHDRHLRFIVAVVITAAWAVSFVVDLLNTMYDPPSSVGALMLLVSGALFGEGVARRLKRRPEDQ